MGGNHFFIEAICLNGTMSSPPTSCNGSLDLLDPDLQLHLRRATGRRCQFLCTCTTKLPLLQGELVLRRFRFLRRIRGSKHACCHPCHGHSCGKAESLEMDLRPILSRDGTFFESDELVPDIPPGQFTQNSFNRHSPNVSPSMGTICSDDSIVRPERGLHADRTGFLEIE